MKRNWIAAAAMNGKRMWSGDRADHVARLANGAR
jgi:hypothetical protein